MSTQLSSNKRIAKNTILLYGRMIIVMLVSLYTTRVVLEILGETDYGIYNVIAGVIVLFSFLNSALTGATQRFLSFALGKNDHLIYSKYYSASIVSYFVLSIIIVVIAESLGLWFVNSKLSIPSERMGDANIVYQLTIITFIINIFKVPFESAVISHERMSFYAYLGIADVVLRLGIVFLLMFLPGSKLILYSALMTLIPLGITIFFALFCYIKLKCRFMFRIESSILKELFLFSSWKLVGSFANVTTRQGGNILINMFFGVTVNAAFGIASQVSSAVNSLVSSFQTAFMPQIIKLYASEDKDILNKLIFRTSYLSFYLLLIIVLPISFNLNSILTLWLVEVPKYVNVFIICLFIYTMIDALQTPLIVNITATGNIKVYEIWLSSLLLLNLPITYIFFRLGYPPFLFFTVYVSLNFISAIVRTLYVRSFLKFPIKSYFCKVILPIMKTTILTVILSFIITVFLPHYKYTYIINILLTLIQTVLIIYWIGIDNDERAFINNYIKKITCKTF